MDTRTNAAGRLLKSLTFRLILLTLASGLGLWLGAGSRSAAAGRVKVQGENPGKWLIADAFRFDLLLARAEPAAPPAVPAESQTRPAAVVVAQSEPVETVKAPMRAALILHEPGPRIIHPRVRPNGAWQMRVEGQMADLRQTETRVQEILKGLPGLAPAEREMVQKRLQCELQRASKALERLALDEPMGGPEPSVTAEVPGENTPLAAPPGCTY